jgi:hypothetical protein
LVILTGATAPTLKEKKMLEVNTKVMIRSSRLYIGSEHEGQIGTIVHISPNKDNCKPSNVFVRVNYELGDDIVWLFEDELNVL